MHFLFTLLFNKSVLPGLGLAISLFPTGWGGGRREINWRWWDLYYCYLCLVPVENTMKLWLPRK